MQCSIFNLHFQIVICHPIPSNNCKYIVPPSLLIYGDTPGVVLEEEQSYIAQFFQGIIN